MFEGRKAEGVLHDNGISVPFFPKFPDKTGDSGRKGRNKGHDFALFAWETVDFMPVDNASLVIRGLSAFP